MTCQHPPLYGLKVNLTPFLERSNIAVQAATDSVTGGSKSSPVVIIGSDPVNWSDFQRLNTIDSAVNKLRPGEAGAAAELQQYLGGRLERVNNGPGDFVFVEGPNAGKTIDFMLTPDNMARAENTNRFFETNLSNFRNVLNDHLNKADIVSMDMRFLTEGNKSLLMDAISKIPPDKQARIILIR